MILEPPVKCFGELDASQRDSVTKWWHSLSKPQRKALQTLIDAPDCTIHRVEPDSPESLAAVDLFADKWETTWEENWESDWREYLTEHPDVRAVTLDFMSLMVKYGD